MAEAPYAVPVPAPTPPKAPQQASELERLAAGFSKDGLDKTAIAHVLTLPAAKQTRLKTLLIVLNTILREIEGADLSVRKENLEARMQGLRGVLRAFIDENTPGRAAAKPAPLVNSTYIDVAPDESDTLYRCAKPNVPELLHSCDMELLESKGIFFEHQLASGNYGSVHRAIQAGKPIAVKIVAHHLYDPEEVRIQSEYELHNYIIRIHEAIRLSQTYALVLDFAANGSLESYLIKQKAPVPIELALKWCAQIARAMWSLHKRQTLHRDLRSANVLLDAELNAKLGDFGKALEKKTPVDQAGHYAATHYVGKEMYSSVVEVVEVTEKRKAVYNKDIDIIFFGYVMVKCRLFGGAIKAHGAGRDVPPDMLPSDTPKGYVDIVQKCIHQAPTTSFEAIYNELFHIIAVQYPDTARCFAVDNYTVAAPAATPATTVAPVPKDAPQPVVSSSSTAANPHSAKWNEEYQKVLQRTFKNPDARLDHFTELTKGFVTNAARVAKELIRREHKGKSALADSTIIAYDVGGVASGEKYVCDGIFFKFPKTGSIYGTVDLANKAASNEAKTFMALANAQIHGLHAPIACLVKYLGRYILAESFVDVKRGSIVYGSEDGGCTVYDGSEPGNERGYEMHRIMEKVARAFNLRKHRAGAITSTKQLYGPTDIEGRVCGDGLLYLLDVARLCPPTDPAYANPAYPIAGCVLTMLFRPEFLRTYEVSLSSDAYLQMSNSKRSDRECSEATLRLLHVVVPFAARSLSNGPPRTLSELQSEVHAHGVNIRYLAYMWHLSSGRLTELLLTEMLARSIKAYFSAEAQRLTPERIDEIKCVAANILNSLLPSKICKLDIAPILMKKFYYMPHPTWLPSDWSAPDSGRCDRELLHARVRFLCGFESPIAFPNEHAATDIEIVPTVKKPVYTKAPPASAVRAVLQEQLANQSDVKLRPRLLYNLALVCGEQKGYDEAEQHLREALKTCSTEDTELLLLIKSELGRILARSPAKAQESVALLEAAASVQNAKRDEPNYLRWMEDKAAALLAYCGSYKRNNVSTWKEQYVDQQQLEEYEALANGLDESRRKRIIRAVWRMWVNLGNQSREHRSDMAAALTCFLRAEKLREAIGSGLLDDLDGAESELFNGIAAIYRYTGDYKSMERYLDKAEKVSLEFLEHNKSDPEQKHLALENLGKTYNNIANYKNNIGACAEAHQSYAKSLEYLRSLGLDDEHRARLNDGQLYLMEDKIEEGAALIETAYTAIIKDPAKDTKKVLWAWAADYLSTARLMQKRVSEAVPLGKEGQLLYSELYDKCGESRRTRKKVHVHVARAARTYGAALIAAGNLTEGRIEVDFARDGYESTVGNVFERAKCLMILGECCEKEGDVLGAELWSRLAFKAFQRSLLAVNPQHILITNAEAFVRRKYYRKERDVKDPGLHVADRLNVKFVRELRSDTPEGEFPGEDRGLELAVLAPARTYYYSLVAMFPAEVRSRLSQDTMYATSQFLPSSFYCQSSNHYHLTLIGDLTVKLGISADSPDCAGKMTQKIAPVIAEWRANYKPSEAEEKRQKTATELCPSAKVTPVLPVLLLTRTTISKASLNCEAAAENQAMQSLYDMLKKQLNGDRLLHRQSITLVRFSLSLVTPEQKKEFQDKIRSELERLEAEPTDWDYNFPIELRELHLIRTDKVADNFQVLHTFSLK